MARTILRRKGMQEDERLKQMKIMEMDPNRDATFQSRTLRWLAKEQLDRGNIEKAMEYVQRANQVSLSIDPLLSSVRNTNIRLDFISNSRST